MCGIAGIQKLKSATTLVERDDLVTMASVMAHRGPDEGGFAVLNQGKLGLAHVRLSIVDVATGQQPLFSADGAVGVSFNGEIYDYQQHRADLLALGYPLKTHSDTEALIYLYIEYGLSFLEVRVHSLRRRSQAEELGAQTAKGEEFRADAQSAWRSETRGRCAAAT